MQIKLISVGNKMPSWINAGFAEYAKRISGKFTLQLHEIPSQKRDKKQQGQAILNAIDPQDFVIALEIKGKTQSTEQLATRLTEFMQMGRHVSLLIGGAEGLTSECLQRSDEQWSLSALTLPHPLVRVVVAEQLYRALMIINQHPYHK